MAAAGSESEMQADLAAQRAACERQVAAGRDPSAWAAFRAGLHSARSGAHQTFSRKGTPPPLSLCPSVISTGAAEWDLAGLQKQLRDLETDLAQTLSLKIAKERKRERIMESISASAAASEQLRNTVTDQTNTRVQHAAVVSRALDAVEALEAKNSEDGQWREDIDKAVSWYQQFAGFQVVEEVQGVRFVFDKVDSQAPEKEFSMVLKFDKDSEELLKDLNLANDLPKFVRITRERIQAASMNGTLPVSTTVCPDASPLPISSPPIMSVDSSSRNDADQSHSQSKNKKKALPAKRRASALSAASPGSVRRSHAFRETCESSEEADPDPGTLSPD
ncbi:kinetochore protein SPC25 homolog [Lolium perenne]|uniref:kinetochore protein SPC25 homolog n=1 Tax=Lolium perenne TaxID=4522 RepID=UPI0021EA3138